MATCPHCHKFLGANHRCGGKWRSRLRALRVMGLGAVLGSLLVFAISSNPSGALMIVTGLLGAIICVSFWRYGNV